MENINNATITTSVPSEIIWINNYLSTANISSTEIDSILCFSLIWNLFEGLVCDKNASVASIERAVNRLNKRQQLDLDEYRPYLDYFIRRYVTNGKTNSMFLRLNFRSNNREDFVRAVLETPDTNPSKTLLAILIIVFRLRNNLFHGEKSLYDMRNQIENFKMANQLLMKFLEQWKR